jgi:hypothetical protein
MPKRILLPNVIFLFVHVSEMHFLLMNTLKAIRPFFFVLLECVHCITAYIVLCYGLPQELGSNGGRRNLAYKITFKLHKTNDGCTDGLCRLTE